MKTFEQAWADTGRQYGAEELEGVRLGWEMARAELATLKRQHQQLRAAVQDALLALEQSPSHGSYRAAPILRTALTPINPALGLLAVLEAARKVFSR